MVSSSVYLVASRLNYQETRLGSLKSPDLGLNLGKTRFSDVDPIGLLKFTEQLYSMLGVAAKLSQSGGIPM